MTHYIAEFRTDAEHGSCDIEATTPEQAMRLARTVWEVNPNGVDWSRFDARQGLTDITIMDEDENVLTEWTDPANLVRQAAPLLLEALEAQAMADAAPEASERKGHFERARELRHAALKLAGRPVW